MGVTVADLIVDLLTRTGRVMTTAEITEQIDAKASYVRDLLPKLRDEGVIHQPRRGQYAPLSLATANTVSANATYNSGPFFEGVPELQSPSPSTTTALLGQDLDGYRAPLLRVLGRTQGGGDGFRGGAKLAPFAVARHEAEAVYGIDSEHFTGFRIPSNLLAPLYRRGEPVGVTTFGALDPETGEPAGVPIFDAVRADGRYLLRSGSMYLLRAVQVLDADTLRLYTHREGDQDQVITREDEERFYVVYKIELTLAPD